MMSAVTRDTGHFNCRDYHVSEPSTYAKLAPHIERRSCASPMNRAIKKESPFPFLRLPLELRQKVYSYLLPFASIRDASSIGFSFARNSQTSQFRSRKQPVIWERGQTNLLCVARKMHDECAALLYGQNIFVLFVKYSGTTFRYQWILTRGLTPTTDMDLLERFPLHYLRLIRQVHISIDHPDSYTGMIKYNVGGKGLTHGLQSQIAKLAEVFVPRDDDEAGLNLLHIQLTNGNEYLDVEKRERVRARDNEDRGTEDVQKVLEPFRQLHGIVNVKIEGAVTEDFATALRHDIECR